MFEQLMFFTHQRGLPLVPLYSSFKLAGNQVEELPYLLHLPFMQFDHSDRPIYLTNPKLISASYHWPLHSPT